MFILSKTLKLESLLDEQENLLSCSVCTEDDIKNVYIKRIASLKELSDECALSISSGQEYTLAFATDVSEHLNGLKRTVLIVSQSIANEPSIYQALIKSNVVLPVDNPRLAFIRLASLIKQFSEELMENNEENSEVVYGKNCIFKDGVIIGRAGFGFERDLDGKPIRFPHFGRVVLGNDIEVGANTVISKGSLEDTVIGDSTKIDDLVYIAHNCKIGKNVMIAGNATLCGGVRIGDGAWVGAGASIKQNIDIGEGAIVGMGAVVIGDVEPYSTVVGNPARTIKQRNQKARGVA